jgi:hypothetical protein
VKVKDQKEYDDWKANQKGSYGKAIFDYAERWANLMEAYMSRGELLVDVAKKASHEADDNLVTGHMYGCAVSILSHCWVHGEQLGKWHNLDVQLGKEGEEANENGTVLNPALVSIGTAESEPDS